MKEGNSFIKKVRKMRGERREVKGGNEGRKKNQGIIKQTYDAHAFISPQNVVRLFCGKHHFCPTQIVQYRAFWYFYHKL